MSNIATTNSFEHFYEVALIALHEYSNEPRLDYLGALHRKDNWIDIVELASCWATDACQYRQPATVAADVSAFKAQLLHDDMLEVVMSRATERIFGRFNEDYHASSTWQHEQILKRMRYQNDLIEERWGRAHSFLRMDDTSHRYILHAVDKECEVARQSRHTINFEAIAEQMLFEVGRIAQEHFVVLALMAAELYCGIPRSDDVGQDQSEFSRQHLRKLATTFALDHVDNCRPHSLSADVGYFEQLFLGHITLGACKGN